MRILVLVLALSLASALPTINKIKERKAIDLYGKSNNPNYLPEDEYITEGDILAKKNDKRFKNQDGRGLTQSDTNYRWPDNTVPYDFDPIYTYVDEDKDWIRDTLLLFTEQSGNCVKFRPKTQFDTDYVRIRNRPGCSSYVGRIGGQQYLNLQDTSTGTCLNRGTIVHEFMHALGVWHEISRYDRDNYVTIYYENIRPEMTHNFNKRSGNYYGSVYNYDSVMHYTAYAFSSNGLKTIEAPVELIYSGYKPADALLSSGDIKSLRGYYQCETGPTTTTPTTTTPTTTPTTTTPTTTPTTTTPTTTTPTTTPTTTTPTTTTIPESTPFELIFTNRLKQTITLKKVQTDGTELLMATIRNKSTYRETTTTGITYKIYNSDESGSNTFVTGEGRFTDSGVKVNMNSRNFRFS